MIKIFAKKENGVTVELFNAVLYPKRIECNEGYIGLLMQSIANQGGNAVLQYTGRDRYKLFVNGFMPYEILITNLQSVVDVRSHYATEVDGLN